MNGLRSMTSTLTSSSETRLYVGNLAPAVDEFALVALFSKFGKISKLDFLFHKSGILRGKPRGYAFIEMSRKDEALKAMVELNNKPLRGKRILVTPANESQYQEHQASSSSKSNYHNKNQPGHDGRHTSQHGRGSALDPMRPTTLSLLKSQQQPKGVNNKIAALEAKLAAMQQPTNSLIEPSQAMGHCPKSSTIRPSSLPENPKTWLNNPPPSTASQNQPHNRPVFFLLSSTLTPYSLSRTPSSLNPQKSTLTHHLSVHQHRQNPTSLPKLDPIDPIPTYHLSNPHCPPVRQIRKSESLTLARQMISTASNP
ncbi:hypothetical protein CROQUDRAFT_512690 [Cronartium quercuum f. sp. fusiforme G11]|uniref:RRM domain-containing protein n=1 Tax=Cronartium quercuum f. sp. fusiforme G11 TaxID=708437 RepID=A0A9P6TCD3_9BASI|nr:hypothetical protein CROQUDRAFT_512690 [Cronartium quercuum f. sp. fusiforme G11]